VAADRQRALILALLRHARLPLISGRLLKDAACGVFQGAGCDACAGAAVLRAPKCGMSPQPA